MTTIVTRTTVGSNTGKGSPLTHTEVDTNFVNLNTAKLETGAIPLGTLQAPSVSFLNDSDTGIFCPQGGNSLAIATGGQYAITCTSTQAVGIKTANPQKALHVAGPTRVGADDATDAFLEIGEGATGNRNSYIDIVADTTYTDYGLRVIRNNTGANATSELKHRGTGALNITTQEAAPIVFNTTNSPSMTITSGGLVGIGTSSPVDVLDTAAGNYRGISIKCGTTAHRPTLSLLNNADSLAAYIQAIGSNLAFGSMGTDYGGHSPRMTLTSTGLGIGVTGPSAPLNIASTGNGYRVLIDDTTNDNTLGVYSDATNIRHIVLNNARAAYKAYAIQSNGITFNATNGSASATIDTSGRLLIGTTTTSATCNTLLQATGGTGGTLILSRNAATPADGEDLGFISFNDSAHIYNNAVIRAQRDGGTWNATTSKPTRLVFATTADGASSPTERMRISNYGRIDMRTDTGSLGGTGIPTLGLFQSGDTTLTQYLIYGAHSATGYSGTNCFAVLNNGNVINTNNSYGAISDIKLKENIIDASSQWADLKALQVRKYNFREETGQQTHTQIGLVAQEVELVSPGLVNESPDRDAEGNDLGTVTKGVNYSVLYMKAVKALQEAMERIETLEARLTAAGIE